MNENGKLFKIAEQYLVFKWGTLEIRIPALVGLLLVGLILAGAIFIYSDWKCGSVVHRPEDVPKIKHQVNGKITPK